MNVTKKADSTTNENCALVPLEGRNKWASDMGQLRQHSLESISATQDGLFFLYH